MFPDMVSTSQASLKCSNSKHWIDGRYTPPWIREELVLKRIVKSTELKLGGENEKLIYEEATTRVVAILKACAKQKDLHEGTRLHAAILKSQLFSKSPCVASSLVCMYAKCGALEKAQQTLDELQVWDVVAWSALIAGYAQHRQGEKALNCFDQMLHERLCPNAATLVCILKVCATMGSATKGKQVHDQIVKQGLLLTNVIVATALVHMYARCGKLSKAREVFDELLLRDLITWNTLIAGYSQHGYGEEALSCFEQMQREGLYPDAISFVCSLKACALVGAVTKGKQIHDQIVRQGLLETNIVLGNALVDMYAKCGALPKARQVLEELPIRDVVTWSALIDGYALHGHIDEALNCFERMQQEGLFPNAVTYVCILKACSSTGAVTEGMQIHDQIIRHGLLGKGIVLGTALVDMYAKCGALTKAHQVLEELPFRDAVSWNALIAGYTQHGHGVEALHCFEWMQCEGLCPDAVTFVSILKACAIVGATNKGKQIHNQIVSQGLLETNVVLATSLIDMYTKCGALQKAQQVLNELPVRNTVTWSALIAGYVQHEHGQEALDCFERMQSEGLRPDAVTYLCILKACAIMGVATKGKEIHDQIVKDRLLRTNIVLGNALVNMYAKCGSLQKAQEVLEELPVRNVVTWSALIGGYAAHGHGEEALHCFEQMQSEGFLPDVVTFVCILKACATMGAASKGKQVHDQIVRQGLLGRNTVLGNALVNMYTKCGALSKAQQVLEEIPFRDVVTWSTLIAGYTQYGQGEEALDCFEQMQREGLCPNAVTFVSILKACASIGAVDKGKEIHSEVARKGLLENNILLGNAVIDMYARCGLLSKAQEVFDKLPVRDVVSWNSLMAGYALLGNAEIVLFLSDQMVKESLKPDPITFTIVLNACSHAGLLEKGQKYFESMTVCYGLSPTLEHYTCMVDLLARAGHLDKVIAVIKEMPWCADLTVWLCVLGACQKWGNTKVGRLAFEHAVQLDDKENAIYICMSNIYANVGRQDDADKIEALRVRKQAWMKPKCSLTGAAGIKQLVFCQA